MSSNGAGSLARLPLPSLTDIAGGSHESPDWLIEGILPQGCFLIVGRPKVGKSWLNLQLGITLACGGSFLGHECLGAFEVVYIAAEDDPGRIAMRFAQYRTTQAPEKLKFICRDDLAKFAAKYAETYTLDQFIDGMLCENPAIKAVIIDTESTVRAVWEGGSVRRDFSITRNDYAEVREFDVVAHRRRVWIGLVNHTAKRRHNRWIDIHELINRTNTALAGASGSIVIADPPGRDPLAENDRCRVLGIRGRDITEDHLLAIEQDEFCVFKSLGKYSRHLQTEREDQILDVLVEIIESGEAPEDGWIPSKQIAEWAEASQGTVKRCMSRMLRAGRSTWNGFSIESRKKKGFRLIPTTEQARKRINAK